MDIHKPHAAKNWREFLIEIGTIVVGILIALGLEQAIESYREHQRVEDSRQAIEVELRAGLAQAHSEVDMTDCTRQQLAVLSDAIGKGERARVQRLLAEARLPGAFSFSDSAWSTALASGITDHLDRNEQAIYPALYTILGLARERQQQYFQSRLRLQSLTRSGLAQSPAASAAAVTAMSELTANLGFLQGMLPDYIQGAEQGLGLKVTPADIATMNLPGKNFLQQCKAEAKAMGTEVGKS